MLIRRADFFDRLLSGYAGADITSYDQHKFALQDVELGLLGVGLQQLAFDAGDGALQHRGDEARVAGEDFGRGLEQGGNLPIHSCCGGGGDLCALQIGAHGVECAAFLQVTHLDGEEGQGERFGHLFRRLSALREADLLHLGEDFFHVESEGGAEQGGLVGEVLVERSNGNAGACGDAGGGQFFLADAQQNLNSGLEDGVDTGGGTRLNGEFAGL